MGGGWSGALDCLQSRVKYIQVKPPDKTLVKFIEAVEKAKTSLKRLFVFFFLLVLKKLKPFVSDIIKTRITTLNVDRKNKITCYINHSQSVVSH